MKVYAIPDEWKAMWQAAMGGLGRAQYHLEQADANKDEGGVRVWKAAVSDRTLALARLQDKIFGEFLFRLAKKPDGSLRTIRTSVSEDPPAMIVYDNDEEYHRDLEATIKAFARTGSAVLDAHYTPNMDHPD